MLPAYRLLHLREETDHNLHRSASDLSKVKPRQHLTAMDKSEPQFSSADSGQNLNAKRTAFGMNTTPNSKRIKSFHDESTEPDVKSPVMTLRIVPFPEKVS